MRKLLRYKDGSEYIIGEGVGIFPSVDYEPEEYDLSEMTDEEFKRFKENKEDKILRKKLKKIN